MSYKKADTLIRAKSGPGVSSRTDLKKSQILLTESEQFLTEI